MAQVFLPSSVYNVKYCQGQKRKSVQCESLLCFEMKSKGDCTIIVTCEQVEHSSWRDDDKEASKIIYQIKVEATSHSISMTWGLSLGQSKY